MRVAGRDAFAQHGATRVRLDGSYARGAATPDSDVDFLADPARRVLVLRHDGSRRRTLKRCSASGWMSSTTTPLGGEVLDRPRASGVPFQG
ncbi:hypothetical protein EXE58_06040 [Nocardioides seonyuensis]|uniref:Polymerase nucleotidyl transferase domain-containing protein n=1 Tax=Nocardioides seonyuensis TaxID=2518371 RepID=A0A4P7ID57_9ACTN|nr:hypothetical protein EXE58_06040 [Nocardioides seonyuensis]